MLETKTPSMSISTIAPTSSNSPTYSPSSSNSPTYSFQPTILTPEPTLEPSKSDPQPSPSPSPEPTPGPSPDPAMKTPEPTPGPSSHSPSYTPSLEPTMQTSTSGPEPPTAEPAPDPSSFSPSPSSSPTADSSSSGLLDCETSYVHCGNGISTCFIDFLGAGGGGGPWGWSIDLLNVNLSEAELVCAVYAGAGQCDFTKDDAVLVGDFVISETAVAWRFSNGIGASDVHFYAGKCQYNDGGDHLETFDNSCRAAAMRRNARANGKYTLTKDSLDPLATEFVFDILDNNSTEYRKLAWLRQDYEVFPLGGSDRRYLSAHATVCPIASTASIKQVSDDVDQKQARKESASGALIAGSVFAALSVALAVGLAVHYGRKRSGGSVSEVSSTTSSYSVAS